MSTALINASLLSWSRDRAQLTTHVLADKLGVDENKVLAWEAGLLQPTFKQAQKWATATNTPFAYLFLSQAPTLELAIPDLRTVANLDVEKPSLDLQETVTDALKKQSWLKEFRIEQAYKPLEFVGQFSSTSKIEEVVFSLRKTLGLTNATDHASKNDYLKDIIDRAESAGILIFRTGIVKSNTHRPLDVAEFRGFAISDPIAPLVFINTTDAPAARLFTLLHELAHIWIGSSGITNQVNNVSRDEEIFCNKVAGEFLVPKATFLKQWNDKIDWIQNLEPIATYFKVSKLVIAKRALDLGCLAYKEYNRYYLEELNQFRAKKSTDSGGGDYYTTQISRTGKQFNLAVVSSALSGQMLLRDAANLLDMKPTNVINMANKLST